MFRNFRPLHLIFLLLLVSILVRMAFQDRRPVATPDAPEQSVTSPHPDEGKLPRGVILSIMKGKEVDGVGILDVLVLGMAGFFIFQFMSGNLGRSGDPEDMSSEEARTQEKLQRQAEWMWEHLASKDPDKAGTRRDKDSPTSPPRPDGSGREAPPSQSAGSWVDPPSERPAPSIETDAAFDAREFIDGAQLVFGRISESLSEGDLEDLRTFATPAFMNTLPSIPGNTRPVTVLMVNGHLKSLREQDADGRPLLVATVVFDALLGHGDDSPPLQVEETWRFVRDRNDPQSTWLLDAMPQARSIH